MSCWLVGNTPHSNPISTLPARVVYFPSGGNALLQGVVVEHGPATTAGHVRWQGNSSGGTTPYQPALPKPGAHAIWKSYHLTINQPSAHPVPMAAGHVICIAKPVVLCCIGGTLCRLWHATIIPSRKDPLSSELGSQPGLGRISTGERDHLGTRGVVVF